MSPARRRLNLQRHVLLLLRCVLVAGPVCEDQAAVVITSTLSHAMCAVFCCVSTALYWGYFRGTSPAQGCQVLHCARDMFAPLIKIRRCLGRRLPDHTSEQSSDRPANTTDTHIAHRLAGLQNVSERRAADMHATTRRRRCMMVKDVCDHVTRVR